MVIKVCSLKIQLKTLFLITKKRLKKKKMRNKNLELSSTLFQKQLMEIRIKIEANVDNSEEVKQSVKKGIDGIGLFRTEYLFMNKKTIPFRRRTI